MRRKPLENPAAERAVLGAILRDPSLYWQERSKLLPRLFSQPIHFRIMQAIVKLAQEGREIAYPAVIPRLPEGVIQGISPEGYLQMLMVDQAEPELFLDLISDLEDMAARRAMMTLSQSLAEQALEDSDVPAVERLEKALKRVETIGSSISNDARGMMESAGRNFLEGVSQAAKLHHSGGASWFLREIRKTLGTEIEFGWLIGILADSGAGKTSLALQQCFHSASVDRIPTLFLSGDQRPEDCIQQICAQNLGIDANDIRDGRISDEEYDRVAAMTAEITTATPLEIRRTAQPRTSSIAMTVRDFKRRHGGARCLIAIDHLKRVAPDNPRASLDVIGNQICGDLKTLAEESECAILGLMQRNSEGAKRDNPRPIDRDLYGGPGVKENFDAILGLFVEQRWIEQSLRIATKDAEKERLERRLEQVRGQAELIGMKCRYSEEGRIRKIRREPKYTRFLPLQEEYQRGLPI